MIGAGNDEPRAFVTSQGRITRFKGLRNFCRPSISDWDTI